MLLLTLVVVAAVLTLRPMVDGLVERVRVPRAVSASWPWARRLALIVGLLGADPVERWHELKAPPDTQAAGAGPRPRDPAPDQHRGHRPLPVLEGGLGGLQDRAAAGVGAAGYEPWWAQHGSLDYFVRNAHSLFVETGAELGVVGLLLLLGFFGAAVVAGVRRRLGGEDPAAVAALLAVLACGITAAAVEWTWEIPGAFLPVVIVAALLCGPALAPGRQRAEAGATRCWGPAWSMVGCACLVAGRHRAHDRREAAREPRGRRRRRPCAGRRRGAGSRRRSSRGPPRRVFSSRSWRSRTIRPRPSGRSDEAHRARPAGLAPLVRPHPAAGRRGRPRGCVPGASRTRAARAAVRLHPRRARPEEPRVDPEAARAALPPVVRSLA